MYTCTNDRYDNNPGNRYEDATDFLAMCLVCFPDEHVSLHSHDGGDTYTDDDGEVVLRKVED